MQVSKSARWSIGPSIGTTAMLAVWVSSGCKSAQFLDISQWNRPLKLSEIPIRGEGEVIPVINYVPRYEDLRGSGRIAPSFSTSTLDGGEWSTSRSCRFTPGERAPGTHWIRWVGPRSGLNAMEERKILHLLGIETRAAEPVAIQTELSRILIYERPVLRKVWSEGL
jgi:hypothetical protein